MNGVIFLKYVFMTDSSSDLTQKQVDEIGVKVMPMEFQIDDNYYQHYPDCRMMSLEEFYEALDNGAMPKTTQINYESFKNFFEPYLKAGKDIIYTGIPTGLSGTYNTCMILYVLPEDVPPWLMTTRSFASRFWSYRGDTWNSV